MAVPTGTPRTLTVILANGSGENRAVWPAGVDGLCLAPQVDGEYDGAWIVVHAHGGRFLGVARDLSRALRMAAGFGYAADWTLPLGTVLSDPGVSLACGRVARDLR